MGKMNKELIESYRKIVLPFVSNQLCKADFEGQGEIDKTEFEQDFNEILNLAISSLNPSGDAISREALKKAIEEVEDDYDGYEPNDLGKFMWKVGDLIDNAPPVETFTLEDMQNNYDAGADSVIGKYDKAKGEWAEFEGGYRCSNCDDIEVYTPNFCPNCGADMRGGA